MDSLDAMRIFVRVVEAGGFAKAARQLDLPPPSVTRAVQALEARVGVRLLNRTTRRLSLTSSGERYLHAVRNAIVELERLESELRHERSATVSGTLRITVPVALGARYLSPPLMDFLRQHPEVRLDVDLSDDYVDLVEQGYDAAVRVGTELPDSNYTARWIGRSAIIITASPRYLAQHAVPREIRDLQDHRCVQYANGSSEDCRHAKVGLIGGGGAIRSNSGEGLRAFALQGAGLIRTPAFLVAAELADGTLVRVLPDVDLGQANIYAVFSDRKLLPLRVRKLIDHLAANLGDLDAGMSVAAPRHSPSASTGRFPVRPGAAGHTGQLGRPAERSRAGQVPVTM